MRKGIIAIIVVAVLVVGYVVGVTTTKKATYTAIENLVLEMEKQGNIEIKANWVEQGSRSAVLEFHVITDSGVPEIGEIAYSETVQLQYGFLNTKWRSQGDFSAAGYTGKEYLFNGEVISAEGAVSRGGLRLVYTVPAIRFTEIPGMEVFTEPMRSTFIMAGDEIRGNVVLPELGFTDGGANNVVVRDIHLASDSRNLNGEFFSNISKFTIGDIEAVVEDTAAPIFVRNMVSTFDVLRKDDTLVSSGTFAVESLDAGPAITGGGDLAWSLHGLNYQATLAFEEYLQNVEAEGNEEEVFTRLHEVLMASENLSFALDRFVVTTDAWGNMQADGAMRLDLSELNEKQLAMLEVNQNYTDYLAVELNIAELPGMVQLMAMQFTAQPMPWKLEWKNGVMHLNGEMLDLSALQ